MSSLIQIQSQIEALQKQATEIRAREFDATVQEILAKMKAFDISLKDLQPGRPAKAGKAPKGVKGTKSKVGRPAKDPAAGPKPAKPARKGTGLVVAAKFKGPNGEAWSGRGLMPRWLSALIAQGRTREEFAVQT